MKHTIMNDLLQSDISYGLSIARAQLFVVP